MLGNDWVNWRNKISVRRYWHIKVYTNFLRDHRWRFFTKRPLLKDLEERSFNKSSLGNIFKSIELNQPSAFHLLISGQKSFWQRQKFFWPQTRVWECNALKSGYQFESVWSNQPGFINLNFRLRNHSNRLHSNRVFNQRTFSIWNTLVFWFRIYESWKKPAKKPSVK